MMIQKMVSITKAENIGAEEVVKVAVKGHKDHDQEKGCWLKIVVKTKIVVKIEIENVIETMALIMDVIEITEIIIMIEIVFGKENEIVIEIGIVLGETMIGTVIATEIVIGNEIEVDQIGITDQKEIDDIDILILRLSKVPLCLWLYSN